MVSDTTPESTETSKSEQTASSELPIPLDSGIAVMQGNSVTANPETIIPEDQPYNADQAVENEPPPGIQDTSQEVFQEVVDEIQSPAPNIVATEITNLVDQSQTEDQSFEDEEQLLDETRADDFGQEVMQGKLKDQEEPIFESRETPNSIKQESPESIITITPDLDQSLNEQENAVIQGNLTEPEHAENISSPVDPSLDQFETYENEKANEHNQDIAPAFPETKSPPPEQKEVDSLETIRDSSEYRIIGTPEKDGNGYHEQQEGQPTCVQASVESLVNKYHQSDIESVTEEGLKQEAITDGAFDASRGGTERYYIKESLEKHGIAAREWHSASLEDIETELNQRHDIIGTFDAGILWNDIAYLGQGHAARITGLRKRDDMCTGVFLRDSGNPDIDGSGEVDIDTFKSAWGGFMVTTIQAAVG